MMDESDLSIVKKDLIEEYCRAQRNALRLSKKILDHPVEALIKEACELQGFMQGIKCALSMIEHRAIQPLKSQNL